MIVETFGKKPSFSFIATVDNGKPTFRLSDWVKLEDVSLDDIRNWER